ncbi:MAG: hypothetical protein PHI47_11805 [Sulfuricurvum sp.]|uniref:hypothetical protein n=1 Tax=Sulfuricurvum sp. TaxID=2025608 RepID=UPI00262ECB16|nr:hypothetical protein [Sulfuricurvum sp.]MDD5160731.1 hypothetical protein [Sulfuricurvum sp.]
MCIALMLIALISIIIGFYRIVTRPSATLEVRSFAMTWVYSMIWPIIVVIIALSICLR